MITIKQYFSADLQGEATQQHRENAEELLGRVNTLLQDAAERGNVVVPVNPNTDSQISGAGHGGWRKLHSPVGAPGSAHKDGRAVDVYDPDGDLDEWITDQVLSMHGLYREHPSSTRGWCHLTTRQPKSGRRSFYP